MKQVVILISGKQGSGKSSLANAICEKVNFEMNEANIKARQYAFSAPIYALHNGMLQQLAAMGIETNEKEGDLLQAIGEWGRKRFGKDVWINIVKKSIEKNGNYVIHANGLISVISDCRVPEEYASFPGALTVRLECPEEIRKARILATPGQSWRENTNHITEVGLDHVKDWSFVLKQTLCP